MNWRELPFVRILFPFLLGILSVVIFDCNFQNLLFISAIAFLLLLGIRLFTKLDKYIFRGIALSLCVYILALQYGYWNNELHQGQHFQTQITGKDTLIARVVDMPEQGKWVRMPVQVETWNNCFECTGNLLLYLERTAESEALEYGDRIICNVQTLEIEAPKNPDAFDYSRYLHFQNIHYQVFIRTENWTRLEDVHQWQLLRHVYRLRRHLLETLSTHLQDKGALAVGSALILGYRADLSDELRTAYADTGAIHVLAVSGLHVGLIYLFIGWLLRYSLPDKKSWSIPKTIILIISIWTFALLTGSSASVLRAATMFSFLAIGQNLGRYYNIYNTLATAAFASLLWNPYLLFQVGFQLSYIAVLGIVYFQPKIYACYSPPNRFVNYIWTLLSVSFAAQLAVSPIGIFYFHQFPFWFWLSSLVVIPAAFLILLLGIFLFIFSTLNNIAVIIGLIMNTLIGGMNTVIFYIQSLAGLITGIWLLWYQLPILYACIISLERWLVEKHVKFLLISLGGLAVFVSSLSLHQIKQSQECSIVLYNIHQNTLIDFFDGQKIYSLQSEKLVEQNKKFAAQQHRWAKSGEVLSSFPIKRDTFIENEHWFYDFPFIQFHKKRLLLLDSLPYQATDSLLHIDYVLLYDNPKLKIEELLQIFEVECLIFDASNSKRKRKIWRENCEALEICYHDTALMGAWIKELK